MDDASLRNELAVERTHLANERTFLAYIRTALALVAGGAALFQFFPNKLSWLSIAWSLVLCGAVTLVVGTYRFIQVKRRFDSRHCE